MSAAISRSAAVSLIVQVLPVLLGVGETAQAHASTTGGGDVSSLTAWTAANPAVATVNASGLVTAVGTGMTNITGVYQSATTAFPLQVISSTDITQMIFAGDSPRQVYLGQPFGLLPRLVIQGNEIVDLDATRVAWSSSDPRVVAIAPNGTTTTVSAGTSRVTATYLGKSATIDVTVLVLDHDTFTIASTGASGLFAAGGHVSISTQIAFTLIWRLFIDPLEIRQPPILCGGRRSQPSHGPA